jgi:hypothetical protein
LRYAECERAEHPKETCVDYGRVPIPEGIAIEWLRRNSVFGQLIELRPSNVIGLGNLPRALMGIAHRRPGVITPFGILIDAALANV